MPKKRVKDQKDLFISQEELFSSTAPYRLTDKKVNGVVAFDWWGGVLRIAKVDGSSNKISYSVIPNELTQDQIERLKSYRILATQESRGKLSVFEEQGLKIETLLRPLAVYWSFNRKIGDKPCLIVSTEANCTRCALILNGKLVDQTEEAFELSLRGIWRSYVESNGSFKRWIEAYKQKDTNFEDQLYEAFLSALETGTLMQVGPMAIIPPIDLSSSLGAFRNLFRAIEKHQAAETIVLSDWAAAHCNLATLLKRENKTVLVAAQGQIFYQAVRGLIVYGLTGAEPDKPPALKLLHHSLTFRRIIKGALAQSFFKIQNVGGGTLQAQIKSKSSWLNVLPDRASCEAGKEQLFTVEIDDSKLAVEKSYSGEIEIICTYDNHIETKKLPVYVERIAPKVGAITPPPPQEISAAPPVELKPAPSIPDAATVDPPVVTPPARVEATVVIEEPPLKNAPAVFEPPVTRLSIIGTIAVILILIAAVVLFIWVKRQSPRNSNVNSNLTKSNEVSNKRAEANRSTTSTPLSTPSPKPTAIPSGMVYVAGGTFSMGSDSGDQYEKPAHSVTVKPFFIDTYEVTCEEYEKFINTSNYHPPLGLPNGHCPDGATHLPVTGVNWDDANVYASWVGKRLPTEEEWEYAARGNDGRRYPWGNTWQSGFANADKARQGLANVGEYKGASPYGAFDLVGNAWEWTSSNLKPYQGGNFSVPPGNIKVIRGGSWREDKDRATTTYRGYWYVRGNYDYSATGFRCALSAP